MLYYKRVSIGTGVLRMKTESVSSAIYQRPKYKSTVNGAVAGAVAGAAGVGAFAGLGALSLKAAKIFPDEGTRDYIKRCQEKLTKRGWDMSKTTVSKVTRSSIKAITKPLNFVKAAGTLAVVGAGIGLAMDIVKNNKAAKKPWNVKV